MKKFICICILILLVFICVFTMGYYNSFSQGDLEVVEMVDIQQPVQYNLREQHIDFEEIVKAHVNHFEKHKKIYKKTTYETDNGVIVHRYMDKDGLVKAEILEKSNGKTLVVEVYSLYKDTLLYIDPRGSFFVSAPDKMMVLDRELKYLDLKDEAVRERISNVLSRLEKLNII